MCPTVSNVQSLQGTFPWTDSLNSDFGVRILCKAGTETIPIELDISVHHRVNGTDLVSKVIYL